MANLSAVVHNYRDVGVERFVMAWAVKDAADLGILRKTLSMPLHSGASHRAARGDSSAACTPSATTDRQRDLGIAERWIAEEIGTGIGDIEVDNLRPIRDVATEILHWLDWL